LCPGSITTVLPTSESDSALAVARAVAGVGVVDGAATVAVVPTDALDAEVDAEVDAAAAAGAWPTLVTAP
jgi:2-hydroxychromene-2-carboxylate isomerase